MSRVRARGYRSSSSSSSPAIGKDNRLLLNLFNMLLLDCTSGEGLTGAPPGANNCKHTP